MAEQRFTIIIVPHDRPGVRKLQITAKTLLYGLIALAICSLIGLGTTIHYVKLYRQARDLANLQKENADLKTNLEQSQVLTQKLNRKLSFLTDLSNKLKVMAGLPDSSLEKKKSSPPPKPGIGGVTMELTPLGAPDPQRLIGLEKRTDYLERSFTLLNDYFQKKNAELSTMPSILPTHGGFLSSFFGSRRNPFTNAPDFHEGLDITNEVGTPVFAPANGTVIFTGIKGNYGNVIEIKHDDDITTLYGHLDSIQVRVGQQVKRWDMIGKVGNTGRSTGPHLHYEIHVDDQPVNPLPYILDLDNLG